MDTKRPAKIRKSRPHIPGQVLTQLRSYIIEQGLKTGDRLPTERQMAMDLKVSRNSVREALTTLESVGAVSRRPKIGCVLQPIDLAMLGEIVQFQLLRDAEDLQELYSARIMLEEAILPLAIINATEEDLAKLDNNITMMENNLSNAEMVHDIDEAFHRALFAAAKNKFLFQFGSLIQVFFRESRRLARSQGDRPADTAKEHRNILNAVRNRDLPKAIESMREHLSVYQRSGLIPPQAVSKK